MAQNLSAKDDKNLQQVLEKIEACDESVRHIMRRLHEVITAAGPELKARIWYGMPGYAKSASSPVLVFFRKDDLMTLGITEKAVLAPERQRDGHLIPAAWYFTDLDDITEQRVAEIVRSAAG